MRALLLAFAAGIIGVQFLPALPDARFLALLPLAALAVFIPAHAPLRLPALMLFAALCGAAYASLRADARLATRLPAHWQGVDIALVGVVRELPVRTGRGEQAELTVERVLTPGAPALDRILVNRYGQTGAPLRAGERWQLTVRLKRPIGTHNPHGFDLEAWALERRITATGYVRTSPPPMRLDARADTFEAHLAALRAGVRERISAMLGDHPYAGVIAALTVGDQKSIPHAQWRAYTRTGVNHLLSISGLHVSMVAALAGGLVFVLWRRVPALVRRIPARQAALAAAVAMALGYALLAGFKIPAQRAFFMLLVLAIAFWGRREPRPFTALAAALAAVLVIDPWASVSAGFWLSFGAMAAIVWVAFGRLARPAKLTGWVTVQGAVTVALAPALFALFQQVSVISPLANALAIPLVSLLVTPLALAGIVLPVLWWPAAGLMGVLGAILDPMSALPGAVWARPAPAPLAVLLALFGTVWLLMPRGFPGKPIAALLWMPLVFPPQDAIAPGRFVVDVIDVGQGTSVLVRTARHALLYDTGASFAVSDAGERIVVPYLRALGVSRLDGLVVSHDDDDHAGGMHSVLRDVPTAWIRAGMPRSSPRLMGLGSATPCVRGQRWVWDGVAFEILNPPLRAYAETRRRDNDLSCVLRVTAGGRRFLVTGDAERRGELELLESGQDLRAEVLVAGHHGSRSSSLPEFVEAVAPAIVVFTVGTANRFGHPHAEVVERFAERGVRILRTDRDGRIQIVFGEAGPLTTQYRDRPRRYWQRRAPDD